jgi:hypothetical protein
LKTCLWLSNNALSQYKHIATYINYFSIKKFLRIIFLGAYYAHANMGS